MRRSSIITTIALGVAVTAGDAEAKLDVYVDKSSQQMSVVQDGLLLYVWPISTGRDRFSTPSGVYTPDRLERMWFSRVYYNSPMPYAIFFHHGYAIHGSYDIAQLGGPASHGCVRLHPQDAALLFAMVEQEGPDNTTIVVGGGGAPNLPPPRYRDLNDPLRPPYLRDDGSARSVYPPRPNAYLPGPGTPPRYYADGYVDGLGRRRADDSQFATRGTYPANRMPPPRLDAEPPAEPRLGLRGSYRPPAMATAMPKSNSKCPTCSPNRVPDEWPNRHVSATTTAKSPPPTLSAALPLLPAPPPASSLPPSASAALPPPSASAASPPPSAPTASPPTSASTTPPPEQQQPSSAYKVLPRAYWAGASWRWRLKAEHESAPPSTPESP